MTYNIYFESRFFWDKWGVWLRDTSVDDEFVDNTTLYIGDYDNPIEESRTKPTSIMEWERDFEHCSHGKHHKTQEVWKNCPCFLGLSLDVRVLWGFFSEISAGKPSRLGTSRVTSVLGLVKRGDAECTPTHTYIYTCLCIYNLHIWYIITCTVS